MKNIRHSTLLNLLNILVLVLLIPAVLYFIFHIRDDSFISNAMGNWFATIIGVFAGGIIAYEVANWQALYEERKREEKTVTERRRRILSMVDWLRDELIENQGRLTRIQEVLNTSPTSSSSLWKYLRTISDSITSNAFDLIVSEELSSELPISFIYLNIAYDTLIGFRNRITEDAAANDYYLESGTDITQLSNEFEYLGQFIELVKQRISDSIKPLQNDKTFISVQIGNK